MVLTMTRYVVRVAIFATAITLLSAEPAHAQRRGMQRQQSGQSGGQQGRQCQGQQSGQSTMQTQLSALQQYPYSSQQYGSQGQLSALQQQYALQAQLNALQQYVYMAQLNGLSQNDALLAGLYALQQNQQNGTQQQINQLTPAQVQTLRQQQSALARQLRGNR